ncbi:hypothetical protein FRC12_008857 [Ceratobasidium sp. 428]|nr:hypothetical protein FRC12_008857 [Ceratobasidium sp. 428]
MKSTTLSDTEIKISKPDDSETMISKGEESKAKEEHSEAKDSGSTEESDTKESEVSYEAASSESGSAVVINSVTKSETINSPASPSSLPAVSKGPSSECKGDADKEDKTEKQDDRYDKKGEKEGEKDYTKGAPSKGPDGVIHDGYTCNECLVR